MAADEQIEGGIYIYSHWETSKTSFVKLRDPIRIPKTGQESMYNGDLYTWNTALLVVLSEPLTGTLNGTKGIFKG